MLDEILTAEERAVSDEIERHGGVVPPNGPIRTDDRHEEKGTRDPGAFVRPGLGIGICQLQRAYDDERKTKKIGRGVEEVRVAMHVQTGTRSAPASVTTPPAGLDSLSTTTVGWCASRRRMPASVAGID